MFTDVIEITNSGGTITYDPTIAGGADLLIVLYQTSTVVLSNNFELEFSSPLEKGQTVRVLYGSSLAGLDRNGNNIIIFGLLVPEPFVPDSGWTYLFTGDGISTSIPTRFPNNFIDAEILNGEIIAEGTTPINRLEDLTSAQIIVGDGSNRPQAVSVTGDVTISNAGVTAIGAGVIVNADVNAGAAIARTKLASGTASQVVINDGSGVMSSEAQLSAARGGTGANTSASTGFATVSAGTWTVGAISDVITTDVSFESGELGDFKIKLPYACTVTEIYAYAYKAIAGADNGTIVPKDNGGTTMTGGTITFTASDARGTAYTSTPSANNTFTAGQLLTLTTAKTTAGGKVLVSIKVTRNL